MNNEKWKTAITEIAPNEISIKGYDVAELMENSSYAQVVYLLLKGELPGEAESKLMEAILVSSIDHGATPPSALAARTVVSGGNPINAAIAGGILAIGDTHGGAIEQSAKLFQEWAAKKGSPKESAKDLVAWLKENKKRMPGYGHRLHTKDPRTARLFEIAEKNGYSRKHIRFCQILEKELSASLKRTLPVNVDGAIAAVMSDMGFDWRLGKGFFIISRTAGLLAQCYEELVREKPMRKLGPPPFDYDGPPKRKKN